MNITLTNVDGTTATALLKALEIRRNALEGEMITLKNQIEALKKAAKVERPKTFEIPDDAQTEEGNLRHGMAEKIIFEYLIQTLPYGTERVKIVEATGIPSTTAYRALKSLQAANKVECTDGIWHIKHLQVFSGPQTEKVEGE